jgi:hypothetical protein
LWSFAGDTSDNWKRATRPVSSSCVTGYIYKAVLGFGIHNDPFGAPCLDKIAPEGKFRTDYRRYLAGLKVQHRDSAARGVEEGH